MNIGNFKICRLLMEPVWCHSPNNKRFKIYNESCFWVQILQFYRYQYLPLQKHFEFLSSSLHYWLQSSKYFKLLRPINELKSYWAISHTYFALFKKLLDGKIAHPSPFNSTLTMLTAQGHFNTDRTIRPFATSPINFSLQYIRFFGKFE
jgi:hypothetical protein